MSEELKACPFCGEKPQIQDWDGEGEVLAAASVECANGKCPAAQLYTYKEGRCVAYARETAIAAWNRRPLEDALVAERDAALARVESLEAENEAFRADYHPMCAWCGQRLPAVAPDDRARMALEHLLACPDHPLRKLEARIEELKRSTRNWKNAHHNRKRQAAQFRRTIERQRVGITYLKNKLREADAAIDSLRMPDLEERVASLEAALRPLAALYGKSLDDMGDFDFHVDNAGRCLSTRDIRRARRELGEE